jgi:hypothetical protein
MYHTLCTIFNIDNIDNIYKNFIDFTIDINLKCMRTNAIFDSLKDIVLDCRNAVAAFNTAKDNMINNNKIKDNVTISFKERLFIMGLLYLIYRYITNWNVYYNYYILVYDNKINNLRKNPWVEDKGKHLEINNIILDNARIYLPITTEIIKLQALINNLKANISSGDWNTNKINDLLNFMLVSKKDTEIKLPVLQNKLLSNANLNLLGQDRDTEINIITLNKYEILIQSLSFLMINIQGSLINEFTKVQEEEEAVDGDPELVGLTADEKQHRISNIQKQKFAIALAVTTLNQNKEATDYLKTAEAIGIFTEIYIETYIPLVPVPAPTSVPLPPTIPTLTNIYYIPKFDLIYVNNNINIFVLTEIIVWIGNTVVETYKTLMGKIIGYFVLNDKIQKSNLIYNMVMLKLFSMKWKIFANNRRNPVQQVILGGSLKGGAVGDDDELINEINEINNDITELVFEETIQLDTELLPELLPEILSPEILFIKSQDAEAGEQVEAVEEVAVEEVAGHLVSHNSYLDYSSDILIGISNSEDAFAVKLFDEEGRELIDAALLKKVNDAIQEEYNVSTIIQLQELGKIENDPQKLSETYIELDFGNIVSSEMHFSEDYDIINLQVALSNTLFTLKPVIYGDENVHSVEAAEEEAKEEAKEEEKEKKKRVKYEDVVRKYFSFNVKSSENVTETIDIFSSIISVESPGYTKQIGELKTVFNININILISIFLKFCPIYGVAIYTDNEAIYTLRIMNIKEKMFSFLIIDKTSSPDFELVTKIGQITTAIKIEENPKFYDLFNYKDSLKIKIYLLFKNLFITVIFDLVLLDTILDLFFDSDDTLNKEIIKFVMNEYCILQNDEYIGKNIGKNIDENIDDNIYMLNLLVMTALLYNDSLLIKAVVNFYFNGVGLVKDDQTDCNVFYNKTSKTYAKKFSVHHKSYAVVVIKNYFPIQIPLKSFAYLFLTNKKIVDDTLAYDNDDFGELMPVEIFKGYCINDILIPLINYFWNTQDSLMQNLKTIYLYNTEISDIKIVISDNVYIQFFAEYLYLYLFVEIIDNGILIKNIKDELYNLQLKWFLDCDKNEIAYNIQQIDGITEKFKALLKEEEEEDDPTRQENMQRLAVIKIRIQYIQKALEEEELDIGRQLKQLDIELEKLEQEELQIKGEIELQREVNRRKTNEEWIAWATNKNEILGKEMALYINTYDHGVRVIRTRKEENIRKSSEKYKEYFQRDLLHFDERESHTVKKTLDHIYMFMYDYVTVHFIENENVAKLNLLNKKIGSYLLNIENLNVDLKNAMEINVKKYKIIFINLYSFANYPNISLEAVFELFIIIIDLYNNLGIFKFYIDKLTNDKIIYIDIDLDNIFTEVEQEDEVEDEVEDGEEDDLGSEFEVEVKKEVKKTILLKKAIKFMIKYRPAQYRKNIQKIDEFFKSVRSIRAAEALAGGY